MTPTTFRCIRHGLGLSQRGLAARLRVEDVRTIRRYETGERKISGPVSLLMEMWAAEAGLAEE
jgi:DNA-binding transcriptional regulator YiaG